MKVLFFWGGLAAILIGGCIIGLIIAHSGSAIVVRNATSVSLPEVRIETDTGENYTIKDLPAGQSRRIRLSGRDAALWLTVKMPLDVSDIIAKSNEIYVTSRVVVNAVITEQQLKMGLWLGKTGYTSSALFSGPKIDLEYAK